MHGISLYYLLDTRKRQIAAQLASFKPLREIAPSKKEEDKRLLDGQNEMSWKNIENMEQWDFFHYAFYLRFSKQLSDVQRKQVEPQRQKIQNV